MGGCPERTALRRIPNWMANAYILRKKAMISILMPGRPALLDRTLHRVLAYKRWLRAPSDLFSETRRKHRARLEFAELR